MHAGMKEERYKKERTGKEQPQEDRSIEDRLQLEGRKAVLEALNHDKAIDKIYIRKTVTKDRTDEIRKDSREEGGGTLRIIFAKAREKGLPVQEVDKIKLEQMSETGNHQGVIAVCPAHAYVELADILDHAEQKGEAPFVLLLDGIMDPHNLGAIIRTAEACGVHGIAIPKRRAAGLTGAAARASAGAVEHMMVARVPNIAKAVETLKEKGLWITCGDLEGKELYEADLSGPVALVIGGEGEGISRLVRKKCDFHVRIPMFGKIQSLNASVAAGVFLYEAVRQRRLPR